MFLLLVTPQSRGNPRSGGDAGALAGSRRKAGIFPKVLSAFTPKGTKAMIIFGFTELFKQPNEFSVSEIFINDTLYEAPREAELPGKCSFCFYCPAMWAGLARKNLEVPPRRDPICSPQHV